MRSCEHFCIWLVLFVYLHILYIQFVSCISQINVTELVVFLSYTGRGTQIFLSLLCFLSQIRYIRFSVYIKYYIKFKR